MNQETKRPIALEDILRLKRAERPPPEFWATFDRELRAKQLAALVEKRPWWRTLPRPLFGFSRYHLPLGAAAVLVVTFLATRDFRPAVTAPTAEPSVPVVAEQASVAASAPMVAGVESSVPSVAESAVVSTGEISVAETLANAETLAPGEVTRLLLGSTEPVPSDGPSARSLTEHFKIAQAAAPAIERGLLSQSRGFEGRALSARATAIEPLAQMTSPSAARTAKFNSASILASSFITENSTRASDRVAHRLSNDDDRLYETAYSRIKARGDDRGIGGSLKF